MYTRLPVWAPSPVADPLFREVPKAVDRGRDRRDRRRLRARRRALRRGRLRRHRAAVLATRRSCAASSPPPPTAAPTSTAARSTTAPGCSLEIVAAVREVIGNRLALGVRLCGDELIEGGTTIDEAVEVARMVEATGQVDYINTSIGVATASLFMIEASMHIPPGYALFIPSAIRKAVDLPVVGVGRFKDPLQAERALAEGHCDLVGVVRGQIADADFAAKARAGATDEIRLCLSCNQECVGRMGLNRWLGCIENPRTGREAEGVGLGRTARREPKHGARRRRRPGRAAGGDRRRPRRPRRHRARAGGRAGRPGAAGGQRAQPGRARRHGPQPAHRVPPARRDDRVRRRRVAGPRRRARARPRRSSPPAPSRSGRGGSPADVDQRRATSATSSTGARRAGRRRRASIDEIGFHHATSVAELLADRGCRGRGRHHRAWSSARTSASRSTWRTGGCGPTAKGIVQSTDLVPMGFDGTHADAAAPPDRRQRRAHAGLGRARRARRARSSGCTSTSRRPASRVERVGDCVAPRRAHAAVVEGDARRGSVR